MDDDRVWSFEKSLWTGDADHYRELVDDACLMVLPHPPFVMSGAQAIEAVANTPRWTEAELSKGQITRPQEGLIVIAYHARAAREGETYEAYCTSTYRRLSHEEWRVVQHQQTLPLALPGTVEEG
ncbi:DUF4440 domain-containing protein [Methylobacterium gnaphalii]|uniref:DUF4440 domain-containing protein n=1 Tax=Methylobacterium gnaphalii TaxID=1010610 RepID=A0A512JK05_9HYPH|nr:DUF4440 domain-containing protein [Methylobacterium gnaphalii]GEP10296.1 hypothetical protein MGN01_21410 [Methylobacterium gnaphalii]GJD70955.1 hypothetical protein MMMDOFMJ_3909 [Methylobacterium gnaphalii]GLS49763.1 hypothetical protein GCM10007885_26130 [Methylobacterium gnaphalii]